MLREGGAGAMSGRSFESAPEQNANGEAPKVGGRRDPARRDARNNFPRDHSTVGEGDDWTRHSR